ncbi:hypothetical protein niasHT_004776 [Heterodera trifolii]|uniref:GB1/RHD3-type G domain-containing protein n=1 Tax=Heterodera trifolii TaxID=157864 RepID=A0ABD2M9I7_9BILA
MLSLSCTRRKRRKTPPASVRRARGAAERAQYAAAQRRAAPDQPTRGAAAGLGVPLKFCFIPALNACAVSRQATATKTPTSTTTASAFEKAAAAPRGNWTRQRAEEARGDDEDAAEQYAQNNCNSQPQQFIYYKPNFAAIERGTQCQMENRNRIRPVQLFVPSSSNPNVLKLNKGGLNAVLGHSSIANRKIVVISMAGAYRKGKSLLLNFFLDYLYKMQYTQKNQELELEEWITDDDTVEGFLYKSGQKRCTAGIWIWAEPILIDTPNGERYAVLLMDTQGCFEQPSGGNACGGNGNGTQHGSAFSGCSPTAPALLALSTMLSSVQCYTMAEGIPDEALAVLSSFVDYGKLASAEAKEFGKPYQRLAFLIRDFKLTDEMIYGVEGGNRLLEKVLSPPADGATDRKISANGRKSVANSAPLAEVRRHIRQCFKDGISCYLLPHPGPKVAEPNSGFRGQVKDMKPLFRDEVKRLVESMVAPNLLKPKMLNGRPMTVRKFVECVREYARIFDSAVEVPDPRAILNANLQLACVDFAMEAKVAYCRAMDRATRSSRMMAEKKLQEAHIKHGIKALNIYDRCPKIYSGDVRNNNLARLQESINHELERYKRLNEEKRVTTCASAMLACGDSPLFGVGLGGAASGAVAATVVTLQMGVVSAGIVAIPVSLTALFGIWVYVTLKPTVKACLGMEKDN